MNLIKVISNELENNRFEIEDRLDKVLNNKETSLSGKKEEAIRLLGQIAVAEISANLWQTYITPKDTPGDENANVVPEQGPEQKPKA